MRTIVVWIGAVLMVGGLWSTLAVSQGLADEPASPSSSSEGTGRAAGKETGGSETVPPVVEGETGSPPEAGDVQERTVSLTQAVHFTDTKGQDVVVGPGRYRVEAEGTNRIRLVPAETGESVVIDVVSFTHQQTVESPVPVTVPDPEQPDVLHLALLLPGGQGVGAIGTYSGVKPRAVGDLSAVLATRNTFSIMSAQKVMGLGGVTGPLTGTLALPDRYTASTLNLTKVANALQLRFKSLSTVVVVPPGLALTNPVNIRVTYKSAATNPRWLQDTYSVTTGFRKFHNDVEGNRYARHMTLEILLTEQQPGNKFVTFPITWEIDLDPLFDVTITPLRFKLNSDCDRIGKSEIRFSWTSPDPRYPYQEKSFSTRKGTTVTITGFAWATQEVSASANLFWPQWAFYDDDLVRFGAYLGGFGPPTTKLLPTTVSGYVGRTIKDSRGQSCTADIAFDVTVTIRQYPNL